MKKKYLILVIFALFLASTACILSRPSDTISLDDPQEGSVEQPSVDEEADTADIGSDQDEENEVDLETPDNFQDLFNNPFLDAFNTFYNMLYPAATNADRAKVIFNVDTKGDFIYSINDLVPGMQEPQVDLVGWGYLTLTNTSSWSGPPPDSFFPCDNGIPAGQPWFTTCPDGAEQSNGDNWHVIYSVFDGPIPISDPNYSYTYAAVFDADGDPNNNFQYMDPYNWDYWQNSDQWYILDWYHQDQIWTVSVLGENWAPVMSDARAVVYENSIFWLIPSGDFSVDNPGFRVSSFMTSAAYDPEDVGGDVNGANPTEPLTILVSDPIYMVDSPYTLAATVLDDDWTICGSGVCKYNEKLVEAQKTEVWCTNDGCSAAGGACSLFSRAKEDSPQDPDSWIYVAGSNQKMQKDWSLIYHCFCVK